MSRIVAIVAVILVNCLLRLVIIVDVLSCCITRITQHRLRLLSRSPFLFRPINFVDFSCSIILLHYASSHEQILIVRCLVANVVTLCHIIQ